MNRRTAGWSRRWHVLVLASLVLGMVLVAPTRHAAATPQKQPIARASFGALPLGPLAAGSETPVELQRRLFDLKLGPALALRVYGPLEQWMEPADA